MKKLLFVFNPHSGKGQIRNKLVGIIDIFVKHGYYVNAYPTQSQLDAYNKVMEIGKEFDTIVCCGGDGTLDEVVSGIVKADLHMPIGYIPAGSTNDFANSLKIPKDMYQAATIAVTGEPFLCDVGKLNEKTFVYVAAFGIFTNVAYETSQGLKNVLGHMAYVLEGAKSLGAIPSHHVKFEANGQSFEENLLVGMVTNSKSVGGMKNLSGTSVELDDGVFEVTLIRTPRNPIEINTTLGLLAAKQSDEKHVYMLKTDHIKFEFDEEVPWTVDGEYAGAFSAPEIRNIRQVVPIRIK